MSPAALVGILALAAAPVAEPGPAFFAAHRERLASRLPPGAVAVLRSAPEGGGEVGEVYRQDSDFWYLTGLPEPDCVAVLRGDRYVLFVQPKDAVAEQWTGRRAGVEAARKEYGADEAYPVSELWERLAELRRGARIL